MFAEEERKQSLIVNMKSANRQALFLAGFSLLDVAVEILFTLRIGAQLDAIHTEKRTGRFSVGAFRLSQYTFPQSPLDVWITSLFRCALCVGVALGVLYHSICGQRRCSRPAVLRKIRSTLYRRLKRLRIPWGLLTTFVFIYVVGKFLISVEFNLDGTRGSPHEATTTASPSNVSSTSPMMSPSGPPIRKVVVTHPLLWWMLGWNMLSAIVQNIVVYYIGQSVHSQVRESDAMKGRRKSKKSAKASRSDSQGSDAVLLVNGLQEDEEMISLTSESSDSSDDSDSDDEKDDSDSSGSSDSDSDDNEEKKSKKGKRKKSSETDKPSTGSTVAKLLKQSLPDWPLICAATVFLLVATISQSLLPLYTGKVIDGIAIQKNADEAHRAIIIMLILSVVSAVCSGFRGGIFNLTCARLNIRLRNRLFSSVVRQNMAFFDTTRTGDITSRLTSDTEKMSDLIGLNINVFARSIAKAIGVLFFMFKLSWKLTILTLVCLPVIVIISYVYGNYYEKLSKKVQTSLAKVNDVAEEVCSSMKTVRSFGWEAEEAANYRDKFKTTYKLQIKESVAYAGYQMTTSLLELSSVVALLFYGGYLVLNSELSAGALVSFILYCEELGNCIEDVGDVFTGLMSAAGAAEKVFKWIEREPDPMIVEEKSSPATLKGEVEFQDVSFTYPSRPDCTVLKQVSFTAKPGEVVALVGPSGGGKSSCVSLVERFYQPDSGVILLDGEPLNTFNHKFLHDHISLVSQEPVLFARSIRDNVKYGLPNCTDDKVEEAAVAANAHDFISALPRGYGTSTGEKGQQLSGGQKQRIAIARSLVRQPKILLLDEATSALDAESEHILQQSLVRAMSDCTVLVVAHRLSTVENATRIVVIDEGKVIEEGSHAELLAANGLYAQLVQRQLHHSSDASESDAASMVSAGGSTGHKSKSSVRRRGHRRHRQSTSYGSSSSEEEAPKRRR